MAEDSAIEWTHHTFNPWVGCTKVSPGCKNCYAERDMDKRRGFARWGDHGTRVVTSDANWRKPLAWDRKAKEAGERHRVFCASLADVFEDREELVEPRDRLFDLIDATPNLDWLLLTKRPENLESMLPWTSAHAGEYRERFWPNVWLGTSVEDQRRADERIPELLKIPAAVRFLSMEPLLGPVDLTLHRYNPAASTRQTECDQDVLRGTQGHYINGIARIAPLAGKIHWIIVGGESGPNARPMHPAWARSSRDQCQAAGVPFFFKQWGEWAPIPEPFRYTPAIGSGNVEYARALDRFARERGATRLLDDRPEGWDAAIVRDGTCILNGGHAIGRVGKKAAGRVLDGRTWGEFPASTVEAPR